MRMKKNEMPFRLREFLPMFDTERGSSKPGKFRRQVEGLAEFLCKQPRTVEAYCSTSEDRTISADDYWQTAVEWVKRKSRSTSEPRFIVYDDNGDQLYETQTMWQAMFLADVDGAVWGATPLRAWQRRHFTAAVGRRSRLRRLARDGIVEKHVICAVFNFDQHCLVDYQLEGVDWLSTPDEFRLHQLETFVRNVTGAAA
ncbi:hypothetical protein [Rhizobium leguminosarum]|uniref:hypothetical protein n=1 Tax=Rhizobium leguminosarum TaxID=384 RepID=UPI003F94F0DE